MKKVVGVSLGMTFSAFLFQACENAETVDELNQNIATIAQSDTMCVATRAMVSSPAIPVACQNEEYVSFLQKLADDIACNPAVAREFAENPNSYCRNNGMDGLNINMDSGLLSLITALGDEELCNAAKNNDAQTYLSVCKSKGLLNAEAIVNDPYVLEFINSYEKQGGVKSWAKTSGSGSEPIVASAVYGCVIAVFAAVAVEAFLVIGTTTWVVHVNSDCVVPEISVSQDVWNLKKTESFEGDFSSAVVDEEIDIIHKHFPKEYSIVDKTILRNFLLQHVQELENNESK